MPFRQAPNASARSAVMAMLSGRNSLPMDRLYEVHWQPLGAPRDDVEFVYRALAGYSGLDFGRVLPSDALRDLRFEEVCWSDWTLDFREDLRRFGMLSFEDQRLQSAETIAEIVFAISELKKP
jgi:hypothetical protein